MKPATTLCWCYKVRQLARIDLTRCDTRREVPKPKRRMRDSLKPLPLIGTKPLAVLKSPDRRYWQLACKRRGPPSARQLERPAGSWMRCSGAPSKRQTATSPVEERNANVFT